MSELYVVDVERRVNQMHEVEVWADCPEDAEVLATDEITEICGEDDEVEVYGVAPVRMCVGMLIIPRPMPVSAPRARPNPGPRVGHEKFRRR